MGQGLPKAKSGDAARITQLEDQLANAKQENEALKLRVHELELKLAVYEPLPKARQSINSARLRDQIVNGTVQGSPRAAAPNGA